MHLSPKQIKLLKRINKTPLERSKLKDSQIADRDYLYKHNLIRNKEIFPSDNSLKPEKILLCIQPEGEAELAYLASEKRRWLIPVIISAFALLISVLALFSSSQSINIYVTNGSSIFTTAATNATPETASAIYPGASG